MFDGSFGFSMLYVYYRLEGSHGQEQDKTVLIMYAAPQRSAPDCSQSELGRTLRFSLPARSAWCGLSALRRPEVPQTAARAIWGARYGSPSPLGPPSFAKEALSASRFKLILKTTSN